jgi:hypothetical protein
VGFSPGDRGLEPCLLRKSKYASVFEAYRVVIGVATASHLEGGKR